jgi:hypothetical protein
MFLSADSPSGRAPPHQRHWYLSLSISRWLTLFLTLSSLSQKLKLNLHACFYFLDLGFLMNFLGLSLIALVWVYLDLIFGFCYDCFGINLWICYELVVVMNMMNKLFVVIVRSDFFFGSC